MTESIPYLISGIIFGFTAGISPGPLLALVIGETMRHGRVAGIKVALAPLVTDLPIVAAVLFVLVRFTDFSGLLGVISFAGALFIAYLGYESITAGALNVEKGKEKERSAIKGILANGLSPHPYLFWITVGGPLTIKAYGSGLVSALSFVFFFYIFLVGSKIVIAVLIDKSRGFINNNVYIWTMRVLGIALFIFSVLFLREGFNYFGVL